MDTVVRGWGLRSNGCMCVCDSVRACVRVRVSVRVSECVCFRQAIMCALKAMQELQRRVRVRASVGGN